MTASPIRSASWRSRPSPWRSPWRCSTATSSMWRCRRWRASSLSRRKRDLDRQRLPARGHCLAAAAGRAGRHVRLPARLLVGARRLHSGFAGLRARADFRPADGRAPCSGSRRGRDHERQHRSDPVHLSALAARPGRGQHGGGGRRGERRKPERRRGDPFGRLLALAVSGQRPDRRAGAGHGGADASRHAARRRPPRPDQRRSQCACLRALHRRDQSASARGKRCRWRSSRSGSALAIGVILVRRQFKLPAPLLPVDLLRRPVFALSLATSITSFGAQSLALVALPFYFEDALGRSAAATGLLLTPWPVATALIAPIAGRLADRFIPGILSSIGLLVMGAGLALVALDVGNPDPASLVWRLAICGLGFGFFQSPNNRVIIGSAPRERSGGAAGLQSTGRLVGQSLGAAFVAVAFGRAPESCDVDRALGRSSVNGCRRLRQRIPADGLTATLERRRPACRMNCRARRLSTAPCRWRCCSRSSFRPGARKPVPRASTAPIAATPSTGASRAAPRARRLISRHARGRTRSSDATRAPTL